VVNLGVGFAEDSHRIARGFQRTLRSLLIGIACSNFALRDAVRPFQRLGACQFFGG